jgi:hypothetical protein
MSMKKFRTGAPIDEKKQKREKCLVEGMGWG